MATGGNEKNMCPVCLERFTKSKNPKFLQCHHTFCEQCIDELARGKPNRTFPCPSCRETTTLPPGGAAGLQANFYIKTLTLSVSARGMCTVHLDKSLKLYCTECKQGICMTCKLTRHDTHRTESLISAVDLKKQTLRSNRQRLQQAVSVIETQVKILNENNHSLDSHVAALEKTIRERHATVVETSRKQMEKQLQRLRLKRTELNRETVKDIEERETNNALLSSLISHVDNVISSGSFQDLLSVSEEMSSGRGSQSAVESLTSREQRPTLQPDLHSTVTDDDMIQTTRDYLGTVCMLEMKVTHKFQCSQDADTEVFSLCHVDDDPPGLYVSYVRLGKNENAPVQAFKESGQCVHTFTGSRVGRISSKRFTKGRSMRPPTTSGVFATYNKSHASLHIKLVNDMSGRADIHRNTVTSIVPLKTESKIEFTINIGRHRAFDVDSSENYFAAVEEGKTDSSTRQVHLYEKPKKAPVSTYQPPMENFQPTDVLFHTLGGQPVLLVADQHNSTLHVLSFQGGQLKFSRFLCQGCPLLKQPTALTVDLEGRVWLACKGGRIVTVEEFM